jgi:hypothetical protein
MKMKKLLKIIKIFIITSTILMIQNLSTFSQTTFKYPYRSVIGKDTVFVLSKDQFIKVNLNLAKIEELTLLNNNLTNQNTLYEKEIEKYELSDSILNDNLLLKNRIISNKDSIIAINKNIIIDKNSEIKNYKLQRNIVGITSLAILILSIFI